MTTRPTATLSEREKKEIARDWRERSTSRLRNDYRPRVPSGLHTVQNSDSPPSSPEWPALFLPDQHKPCSSDADSDDDADFDPVARPSIYLPGLPSPRQPPSPTFNDRGLAPPFSPSPSSPRPALLPSPQLSPSKHGHCSEQCTHGKSPIPTKCRASAPFHESRPRKKPWQHLLKSHRTRHRQRAASPSSNSQNLLIVLDIDTDDDESSSKPDIEDNGQIPDRSSEPRPDLKSMFRKFEEQKEDDEIVSDADMDVIINGGDSVRSRDGERSSMDEAEVRHGLQSRKKEKVQGATVWMAGKRVFDLKESVFQRPREEVGPSVDRMMKDGSTSTSQIGQYDENGQGGVNAAYLNRLRETAKRMRKRGEGRAPTTLCYRDRTLLQHFLWEDTSTVDDEDGLEMSRQRMDRRFWEKNGKVVQSGYVAEETHLFKPYGL